MPQTDAIFGNVAEENRLSDKNPKSLRLSIDTKAKVKIGNLSRNGKARTIEAKQADDHDTEWQSVLVPFGILNLDNDELSIYFVQWAVHMTWKAVAPVVYLVEGIYEKGTKVLTEELEAYLPFW